MGVPSLFRWLTHKFPNLISQTNSNTTDNLYLDFNAIIHSACHPTDGPIPLNEYQMLQNINTIIDTIMLKIKPRKLLFISIDGVAPRAKLNQQRARRYKTAMDVIKSGKTYLKQEPDQTISIDDVNTSNIHLDNDSEISELKEYPEEFAKDYTESIIKEYPEDVVEDCSTLSKSDCDLLKKHKNLFDLQIDEMENENDQVLSKTWDTNSITPGTLFMEKVDQFMNKLIQYKITTSELWTHLEVIFSGCAVPGEGEQKILKFIRSLDYSEDSKTSHLIYSPDADLIFLCIGLFRRNVRVLREDLDFAQRQKRNYCTKCQMKGHISEYCGKLKFHSMIVVDTVDMRQYITNEYKMMIKIPFDPERMIADFIFLGFLAGNDFLPTMQCFDVRFEAIEQLIFLQAENFKQTREYLTDCHVYLSPNQDKLHSSEIRFETLRSFLKLLARHENHLYTNKKKKLDAMREQFHLRNFESIPLDTGIGKNIYYKKKLQVRSESDIEKICKEYLQGLAWVFSYYMSGNKNWDWYYPYHYAPFAIDLANITDFQVSFPKNEPLSMLEQLMIVLPPQSKELVPTPLQNISKELPEYFPETVEIDMFDKILPWQGVVLLPPIDIHKIRDIYSRIRPILSINDIKKNVKGNNILYLGYNHNNFVNVVRKINDLGILDGCDGYKGVFYSSVLPGQDIDFMGNKYQNWSIGIVIDEFKRLKI
ncbi:5'-3' exoribonuclease 2 [Dictyocoela muelleri]|nr:5'-3' exoribonuclease 2 [Dictyocoela muelleri]